MAPLPRVESVNRILDGVYRALIVHNHMYDLQVNGLRPLKGPKVDGGLLARALSDPYVGMFKDDNIQFVEDCTAAEIQKATSKFFGSMGPQDTALFYFSGHGRFKNGRFYLCARDTEADYLAMAVSNDTLNSIIDDSSARTKIIILDCCHSGAFKGFEDADAEKLWHDGRYVLMATSAIDLAEDSLVDGEPSPFTKVMVDGLLFGADDSDGDRRVSLDDLYNYLWSNISGSVRPGRKWEGSGAVVPIAKRAARDDEEPAQEPTPAADPTITAVPLASLASQAARPFLDETTSATTLNAQRVADFRKEMRHDLKERIPDALSAREFVQRAGLMREDLLTRAGALLFGDDPTCVCSTALVQCARYFGTDRSASVENLHIEGTLAEQLQGAHRFVLEKIQRGEAPTVDAVSQPIFDFSPLVLREVIANAIVHRDYSDTNMCVHVRVFDDRIEVSNPGPWQSPRLIDGETKTFDKLVSDSRRGNFLLTKVLSWMKLVEGEGAGVPRSIADSRRLGAPVPRASSEDGVVTVTIFPRPKQEPGKPRRPGTEDMTHVHRPGTFPTSGRPVVFSLEEGRRLESKITVRLSWDPEASPSTIVVHLAAFLVASDGQVPFGNPFYCVNHDNDRSKDGSTIRRGRRRHGAMIRDEVVTIDLGLVDEAVHAVRIVAYLQDPEPARDFFGQLVDCKVEVMQGYEESRVATDELNNDYFPGETAVLVGEIVRRGTGDWIYRAISAGYADLAEVGAEFGVTFIRGN